MLQLQIKLVGPHVATWRTIGVGYPSLDNAIKDGRMFLDEDDVQAFRVMDDYGTVLHEEESE